jgi:hypothetical protein
MRRELETVPKDGKSSFLRMMRVGPMSLLAGRRSRVPVSAKMARPSRSHRRIGFPCIVMRVFCPRAMSIFCKEEQNRAMRRILQSDSSSLCPQVGLRSNGRRRRKMPLRFGDGKK